MPRDIAAIRLKITQAKLEALESGATRPTTTQFRKIASAYRRPTAFFYLRELPPPPKPVKDFRKVQPELHYSSQAIHDAFSQGRTRREKALELASTLNETIPVFGVRADRRTPATTLSAHIRRRLGVSVSEQLGWKADAYKTLRLWSDAIESAGVIVSQFSDVAVGELRGFSITDQPFPIVCANGKDGPQARLFTLFHELAHVAMGDGGFCDLHNQDEHGWVEPFCNQVAGEALVPSDALDQEQLVRTHSGLTWTDGDLKTLAARFGVGVLVILRRLLSLERTTKAFYREKHAQYTSAAKAAAKHGKGILLPFKRAIRDNGRRFAGMVLNAYEREHISGLELSRLLGGIRLKHLPALMNEIRGAA